MSETSLKECPPCYGKGQPWRYGDEHCPKCEGKGRIAIEPRRTEECRRCYGRGRLQRNGEVEYTLCNVCAGYGAYDPNPPSVPAATGPQVWFVKSGQPYTERKRLAEVLDGLTGEVRVCDPYFGPGVLVALEHLKQCDPVRCLTSHFESTKSAAVLEVQEFKIQHTQFKFAYLNSTGALHDRYVLTDERLILIGYGLKDFGKKETFVLVLERDLAADTIKATKTAFDGHWKNAKPLG